MASERELSASQRSDTELWELLCQNDAVALGILYDRYAGLVYAIALKALKNTQDAEDLTHDIFLKLAHTGYNPERGSLKTFLAVLTRSRSIDRRRSQQREQSSIQTWKKDIAAEPNTEALPEQGVLAQSQQSPAVKRAIAQLSSEQQQVLDLAYRAGLSQREIAEQLKIPLGTIKARTRRALIKLRQALQSISEEES